MTVVRRAVAPAVAVVVVIAVAVLVWAWRTPSGYFVLWPDRAHPAAAYLHVPGGTRPAASASARTPSTRWGTGSSSTGPTSPAARTTG